MLVGDDRGDPGDRYQGERGRDPGGASFHLAPTAVTAAALTSRMTIWFCRFLRRTRGRLRAWADAVRRERHGRGGFDHGLRIPPSSRSLGVGHLRGGAQARAEVALTEDAERAKRDCMGALG